MKLWKADEVKVIEEPRLAAEVERKLPWLIDVLLYPASLHGVVYIAIFLALRLLIDLLGRFVFSYAGPYGGVLSLVLYILLIGYVFYYFGYCIFDSSKGGRRAPDISIQHTPDKGDLISQLLLILGSVAICFWPVAVYYIFTQRTDLFFWLLSGLGIIFFPMALLTGVLFDSFDALNPILIIRSIFVTFLPYCGLILSFCVFGGLVAVVLLVLRRVPVLGFLSNVVKLYLLLVAAHLLGRFYWWNKGKLNWEV